MSRTERLESPQQFGKYELVARLAHGRMGDVYKAKSHGVEGFEKVFVVKVLNPALTQNPSFVETVIEEAKRTVTLSHANVVQVFDLGLEESSGNYYIAQEYVAGFDLGRSFRLGTTVKSPLEQELGLFIASEVAKGLDYAHRRKDYNFNSLNLLHGDLSPRNIMLSFDGEVKITDFGMARALALVPAIDNEDVIERLLFSAPEVVRGEPHSQSSDIFSLGLLTYNLLTGRHPYYDRDPDVVRDRAMNAEIPPLTDADNVPRQLMTLLESMLVPDPNGRTNSAGTVYEELVAYIFSNNLRADTRALGLYLQELKRQEFKLQPDETTQELGLEEISLADLQILHDASQEFHPDSTNAELPSHKIASVLGQEQRPSLPGSLEEHFASCRAGNGKAVLVSGELGAGRNHLPDRLPDALGWRGETRAFSIQTTPDDRYAPFGVLADFLEKALAVEGSSDGPIEQLRDAGTSEGALETFGSLWTTSGFRVLGAAVKQSHLLEVFENALGILTREGPLVLVIDNIESIDRVSLDVLRHITATIGERSFMLVMCTSSPELARSQFNLGNPENLVAVHANGERGPGRQTLANLSDNEASVLGVLSVTGHKLTQADVATITGLSNEALMGALKNLSEAGLIRVPQTGHYLSGTGDYHEWLSERLYGAVESMATSIARHFKHRIVNRAVPRFTPTLVRLYAIAGDRRRLMRDVNSMAGWLEYQGWFDTLSEFYAASARLVSQYIPGSPNARIDFMLRRAELALKMANIDICRASLEPVLPLSETVRNDFGSIRGQLLMGQMSMQQDDLVDAYHFFRRAITAAQALNSPDLTAKGMLAMARWHDRYGDARTGQTMIEGAMNLFTHWGSTRTELDTRALLLNRYVRLMNHRGMHFRADQISMELERLAEVTGMASVRCRAQWARANVLQSQNDYANARQCLSNARRLAYDHGLQALLVEVHREETGTALLAGDYEDVIGMSEQLVELGLEHQDFYSAQRGHDLKATALCMLQRDVDESLNHLATSLARARERNVPKDIYRCHLNMAMALDAVGRSADAQTHRDSAHAIRSELRWRISA